MGMREFVCRYILNRTLQKYAREKYPIDALPPRNETLLRWAEEARAMYSLVYNDNE